MKHITVELQPSNHYTQITHRYTKTKRINDPLLPSSIMVPTHKLPAIEFLDFAPIDDHDLLCDCMACNETFGQEQERLHNMEMERENQNTRRKVNSYGTTI